jgi:uncharacterized protein YbjT (DUF2867 family)
MDVVIAGGHGQIALHLERLLADAGHRARGLIRKPEHADDLHAAGAEPVLGDLEALEADELAEVIGDAEAIVFAAGAGPGSGAERKWTVDYGGAVKLIDVARSNGINRYVIVSSMGADAGADDDGGFGTYLRAKGQADDALAGSGLDYTIVRPGALTGDPPAGTVSAAPKLDRGQIPRADVAATIVEVLGAPGTTGLRFDLVGGPTPIAAAVAELARARPSG